MERARKLMSKTMPKKLHLPQANGRTFCGLGYRDDPRVRVIDIKRQAMDEATCLNCHRIDDSRCIKNHLRECAEANVDPNTLQPLPKAAHA